MAILERGEYFCSQLLYMINVILSEINVEVFLFYFDIKEGFFLLFEYMGKYSKGLKGNCR